MDARMMHDALRADVLAAALSHDPRYGIAIDEVKASVAEHAKRFKDDIAENLGQAKTDVQKQIIGRLKYPLDVYIKSAEKMVDLIGQNPDEGAKAMPDFIKKFEALEDGMGAASKEFEQEQTSVAEQGEQ